MQLLTGELLTDPSWFLVPLDPAGCKAGCELCFQKMRRCGQLQQQVSEMPKHEPEKP
ncbi:hypothetical protein GJ744_006802 [Endocarpon pusillum]|uniref:Uncharacterized protein n=1 Tax=Endocarpon pusillum TaxID=364733 RepID=A0A8H7ANP4_9EURO|nr:hypothetical protein GJ744_006802 [Endocarpon pusillum]